MDILIKDLALPEDGAYDYHITIRSDGKVEGRQQVGQRIVRINSWAVEVPPHGDLVDSKELFFKFNSEMRDIYGSAVNPFCIAVADAPTVLEASNG